MSVLHLTKGDFDATINSEEPVLVDFWASWCGPCRMIGPIIEELAVDYAGKAKVCKVDVDAEQELAQRFQVMTIPTVMVFKGGEMKEKIIGARAKEDFADMIDKQL